MAFWDGDQSRTWWGGLYLLTGRPHLPIPWFAWVCLFVHLLGAHLPPRPTYLPPPATRIPWGLSATHPPAQVSLPDGRHLLLHNTYTYPIHVVGACVNNRCAGRTPAPPLPASFMHWR